MTIQSFISLISIFSAKKIKQFQQIEKIKNSLFSQHIMHSLQPADIGHVQISSANRKRIHGIENLFNEMGVYCIFLKDLFVVKNWNMLLVDIDSFGGTNTIIDQLIILRKQNLSLVTILLSADFLDDDLTAFRLTLCDACLRLPYSSSRFEQALSEAINNNLEWQDRCAFPRREELSHNCDMQPPELDRH